MTQRRPRLSMIAALVVVLVLGTAPAAGAVPASTARAVATTSAAAVVGSGVVRTKILGYSVARRPILAYELGDPSSTFKAVVLGNMHGTETAGLTVTASLLTHAPIHGVDLWVVPTMNPDGVAGHTRGNAHGVDLNRNWPNAWIPIPPTADGNSKYSGPRAVSEPETRALYTFLLQLRPARLVSMHQPLVGVDTTDGGARDPAFRRALATGLGLPEKPLTCNSACHGSLTGWMTNHQAGAGITVEFSAAPTAGYLSGQAARGVLAAIMVGHATKPPPRLTAAAARHYVDQLARSLLGRPAAPGNPLVADLVAGRKTRADAATSVATSQARAGRLVERAYRECLGRAPNGALREQRARALRVDTGRWDTLIGVLCGSAEAYRRAGSDREPWVDMVFRAELGRAATATERRTYAARSRSQGLVSTATFLAATRTASSRSLGLLFDAMLGRAADAAAVRRWGPSMPGRGIFTVAVQLATSASFLQR